MNSLKLVSILGSERGPSKPSKAGQLRWEIRFESSRASVDDVYDIFRAPKQHRNIRILHNMVSGIPL